MPAIVSPRKTSSDSSRSRPVDGDVALIVFGVIVVSVEVAIVLRAQLSLYIDC